MTEEQRQSSIFVLSHQLATAEAERDKAQLDLCAALSKVSTVRAQLRELGYMHPDAKTVA